MSATGASPRDRLLDAAETRFRRYGFRHASVETITRAAGTGKGSLYLHYRSKEELYLEVVARAAAEFVDEATRRIAAVETAPAQLGALVEAAIEHYESDDLLRASIVGDDELVSGAVADLASDMQQARVTPLIEQTLRAGQAEGSIRPDLDPHRTAIVLFEIGWAIVRRHLEHRLPIPLAEALSTLNDIVGRGTMQPTRRGAAASSGSDSTSKT